MRVYHYGRFRCEGVHHLMPAYSAVDVVDDKDVNVSLRRWYQVSLLGHTLNLVLPTKKCRKAVFVDIHTIVEILQRAFW